MKKKTIHIIFIFLSLFVSCKKETKTDEKTIIKKTELKAEQIDTLKKKKETIKPKKKPKKEVPADTLIIQKDTLFIENQGFLNKKKLFSKCHGKLNNIAISFVTKTSLNSEFLYFFGENPEKHNKIKNTQTILITKSDKIIDKLELNIFISPNYYVLLSSYSKFNLDGVEEIIKISYSQAFCGGNQGEYSFFRKKDRLIKGLSLGGYGEPGTEYFSQEIITPKNNELNQIWIENKLGKDRLVYFTDIEKYELRNDSLVRLNPKNENIYFVTARSGLTKRSEPSMNGVSLGKLPFKNKVNILNKTDIKLALNDKGKQVSGHWVQIDHKDGQPHDHSFFVFDGYLSKNEPTE